MGSRLQVSMNFQLREYRSCTCLLPSSWVRTSNGSLVMTALYGTFSVCEEMLQY